MHEHFCHAICCREKCKKEHLFCSKHWRMVPRELRQELLLHYRPGQCVDRRPSREWMIASRKCRNHVGLIEGTITPEHAEATLAVLERRAHR